MSSYIAIALYPACVMSIVPIPRALSHGPTLPVNIRTSDERHRPPVAATPPLMEGGDGSRPCGGFGALRLLGGAGLMPPYTLHPRTYISINLVCSIFCTQPPLTDNYLSRIIAAPSWVYGLLLPHWPCAFPPSLVASGSCVSSLRELKTLPPSPSTPALYTIHLSLLRDASRLPHSHTMYTIYLGV